MDDIKLPKILETLIQAVRIYCQDIGMKFGIEICVMLIMISRKRQIPNQEKIRTLGKKEAQELGNIGIGHHQTSGDENKY